MEAEVGIWSSPSHCTWHRSGTCPPHCVCTSCTADGPLSSVQTALSSRVWCQGVRVSAAAWACCVCCKPYQRCCRTVCCCRTGMAGALHLHGAGEATAPVQGWSTSISYLHRVHSCCVVTVPWVCSTAARWGTGCCQHKRHAASPWSELRCGINNAAPTVSPMLSTQVTQSHVMLGQVVLQPSEC